MLVTIWLQPHWASAYLLCNWWMGLRGDRVVLRWPSEVTQTGEPKGIAKDEVLFLPLDI